MAKFQYVLTTESGVKEKGVMTGGSKEAVINKLRKKDKIIISVIEQKHGAFWFFGKPSLSMQDKMIFVKNMATMIKVGVTITEAFEIIISQTKNARTRRMYEDILDMIRSGQTLAKSLRKYDYIFSEIFINMIQTGEQSGNLEKVLQYLDTQLEKEYEIRKKVFSALIYPAVIISITVILAISIVVFIMPKITNIFTNFKIDLPLPTRLLIGFSNLLTQKTLLSIGIFAGIIAFFILIFKLKALKPFWHRIVIYIPVFGNILISANVARFSRTLNSLLQASVPVTDALRVIGNMLNNSLYKKALYESSNKVEKGGSLGDSFGDYEKLFPPLATKLLYIGEKTGSLEETTSKIAELYEQTVDNKTKNLSVLLEPMLLVIMAVLVGGIALSIIMPIYQLPNLISR